MIIYFIFYFIKFGENLKMTPQCMRHRRSHELLVTYITRSYHSYPTIDSWLPGDTFTIGSQNFDFEFLCEEKWSRIPLNWLEEV